MNHKWLIAGYCDDTLPFYVEKALAVHDNCSFIDLYILAALVRVWQIWPWAKHIEDTSLISFKDQCIFHLYNFLHMLYRIMHSCLCFFLAEYGDLTLMIYLDTVLNYFCVVRIFTASLILYSTTSFTYHVVIKEVIQIFCMHYLFSYILKSCNYMLISSSG